MNSLEMSYPIIAAAMYCFSIAFVKLATAGGRVSPTSVLFFNNIAMWAIFLPSTFAEGGVKDISLLWQPILIGVFFSMGNFATFLCAHKGEVSLMTPVMGVKILLVLLFAKAVIGMSLPPMMITSAAICCAAVFIMGYPRRSANPKKAVWTFVLAMWACASYAMCDVLFQKFAPNFSPLSLMSISNFVLLLSSLPFLKGFLRDIRRARGADMSFAALAAGLMVAECVLMVFAITGSVGAPLCNILYNTRGIFSVALIFILGKKIPVLAEVSQGSAMRRAAGSLMILSAVAMVLF